MIPVVAEVLRFLDEQKNECVVEVEKLIMQDAPKNKFSIVTGKLQAYRLIQDKIEFLEQQNAKS